MPIPFKPVLAAAAIAQAFPAFAADPRRSPPKR